MTQELSVARHYADAKLMSRIQDGLRAAGLRAPLDPAALWEIDELHAGGHEATVPFLDQLGILDGQQVLDLGCGLGGAARYAARHYGAEVIGVDLSAEYVSAGKELTRLAGQSARVKHVHGNIVDLPFLGQSFDCAYMIHVGMNIADKLHATKEIARILKPGAMFGIFDIMRMSESDITYPQIWADSPRQSAVVGTDRYRFALEKAGFEIVSETNYAEMALKIYKSGVGKTVAPGHLGLEVVMGSDTELRMKNLVDDIGRRNIAPYVMIARVKP
ncbi:MAG: class I SAM-dependent methyltransferase [Pseudomonadota bacterium]